MERDQLASRDEWQALLSDYVRNALSERLQTRDSPQFNRCAWRDEAGLRGRRGRGAGCARHTAVCSTADLRRSFSLLFILDDFASPDKRAQTKARLLLVVGAQADCCTLLVANSLYAAGDCGGGDTARVLDRPGQARGSPQQGVAALVAWRGLQAQES